MRVVVTGASGFLGRAVVKALIARGDEVVALSRRAREGLAPAWRVFDPLGSSDPAPFEGADGVIHLAGETVSGRWTPEKKKKIFDSRALGTRTVVASIAACEQPPRVLVSASGAGYYGDRGDTPLVESAPPGNDFLAEVCIAWEREASAAQQHGVRVAMLRQGIVLGPSGGALAAMLPPFRAYIGGPLGSGGQWWPWIHLDDAVALMLFALDRDMHGPINAVSPDIATNARFSHALGHALKRPALAYAPPFALRLILGEFAESLLASQLVLAANALDAGFTFAHERLEEALLDIVAARENRRPATQTLEDKLVVNAPLEKVSALFADARTLERITPPSARVRMITPVPVEMRRGTVIEYALKVRGIPMRWKALIARWQSGAGFTDYALRSAYELWRHEHRFEGRGGQTLLRDRVTYTLPLAPLSNIALPLVRADLARIFKYRRARIAELLRGS